MILELRHRARVLRIMSGIVRPRRHLVQQHVHPSSPPARGIHEEQLDAERSRGAVPERIHRPGCDLLAPVTDVRGHVPGRGEDDATDGIGLYGRGGGVRAGLARGRPDDHYGYLAAKVNPSLGVQRVVGEVGFLQSEIGEGFGDGVRGRFLEDGVAPSVVRSLSRFEHEGQAEGLGRGADGFDGGEVHVGREGDAVLREVFLLYELVLDDPNNPARRLDVHALLLQRRQPVHAHVFDLHCHYVATLGQLAELRPVVKPSLDDPHRITIPAAGDADDLRRRTRSSGGIEEFHVDVETGGLEGHHPAELAASDASHAEGGGGRREVARCG
mmetsp:Transcript_10744/g.26503  ORF Transcript_10744/g.26503 Transcript_10744/m.26503 type:complete len:328 (-) Transcript_10744:98-1081(-)